MNIVCYPFQNIIKMVNDNLHVKIYTYLYFLQYFNIEVIIINIRKVLFNVKYIY